MATLASEIRFGNLSTYNYISSGSYDANKLGLGTLLVQETGSQAEQNYIGPSSIALARPVETAGAVPGIMPWAMSWSDTKDWIFLADGAAVSATRRVQLFEYNRTEQTFSWKGSITLTLPSAGTQGTYASRAFRMTYDLYTTGSVSVSGSVVTGVSTDWSGSLAVGSRIGFGSNIPSEITTWYEITAIPSHNSISLTTPVPDLINTGSYVVEELRAINVLLNAVTATNSGLFLTKGLRYENFAPGSTSIPAATTLDNIRATYWLTDASTNTNIAQFGTGIEPRIDRETHYLWVGDTVANPILFKYNLRKPLLPAAGKDINAFIFKTGQGGAPTGTIGTVNNGRIITMRSGTGANIPCFYFASTTRLYRTADINSITAASTTWLTGGDILTEVPPGAAVTFPLTGALSNIEYSSAMDKLIVMSTSATGFRSYITGFQVPFDRIFLNDFKFTPQLSSDSTLGIIPNTLSVVNTIWSEGGIAYLVSHGTTAITNLMYAIPIAADWEYAATSYQRAIIPKMATPNCSNFLRIYINEVDIVGGKTGYNLGVSLEPSRVYYRTFGIDDNSGVWQGPLDSYRDLSGVSGADYIQLMFEFKTIGITNMPARVLSATVLYTDWSTDSHYQPSIGKSDLTTPRFAWRFATAFGTTVPALRIRLYDAVNGNLLVNDTTSSLVGTWEKSINDGAIWSSWDNTDLGVSSTTYLRYTPASIGSGLKIRALLTLA